MVTLPLITGGLEMKTEEQINKVLDRAVEAEYAPKLFGMSYEQGVRNALDWVLENSDDDPVEG